jgi:hypothetical protein
VQALGITVSEFFGQVEQERSRDGSPPPLAQRLDRLEKFDETIVAEFVRLRMEIDKIRRDTGGDTAGEPLAPLGARRRRPRLPGDTASARSTRDRRVA